MLKWRQAAGGVSLVEEAAGLDLDVLAIGIGQQVLPDHALAGQAPNPYLAAGLVAVRGAVRHAKVLVVPVAAEELGQASQHVI